MFRYIAHRILVMIPTLLAVSAIVFIIIQLPPGDFLDTLISELEARGEAVDPGQIEALKVAYGLDKSQLEQYFTWLFGLLTVFSFNIWSDFKPLAIGVFAEMTLFDLLDYLTANIMLPLGGLLIAVFAVWKMSRAATLEELHMGDRFFYPLWRFLVRYITPIAVIIVFLNAIGLLGMQG